MSSALASNPAVRAIGLALIWFVLQGAIIGAAVALLLAVTRHASAHVRYLVACAGLAALAFAPTVTLVREWQPVPVVVVETETTPSSRPDLSTSGAAQAPVVSAERPPFTADRAMPAVVFGWMTGVLVLTVRLLGGWVQVMRLRRRARVLRRAEWADTVARLAARLNISRAVPLLESTLVGLPVTIGWLRPVILVPAGVLTGLTPDHVEAILAHELAHIRRGDYLVNALQRVLEIVLFYHPVVWWISAAVRRELERCCDDLAAPLSPSPLTYAGALVALEERRDRAPALAMAVGDTDLFARIRRIADPASIVDATLPKGAVMTIVSTVVALVLAEALSVGHAAPAPLTPAPLAPASVVALAAPAVPAASPLRPPVAPARAAAPSLVVTLTPAPQAQGSIRGTITDQLGSRVPGATITVDPIGRDGQSRTATSDRLGQFAVADVPDGAYLLTVKLSGFALVERRVQIVSTGPQRTEDVQLRLGSVREAVNVVGADSVTPTSQVSARRPSDTTAVGTLLDAARQATDAGRLADAETSLRQALAILNAARPAVTGVPAPGGAVRVGGDIKEPKKIRNVPPVYPAVARAAGIQGVVTIDATINGDGLVEDARVVNGVPELNEVALDAVRQWAFTPTLLSGVPVSVLMTVTVNFSLK